MSKKRNNIPKFTPNYPHYEDSHLLTIPERLNSQSPFTGRGVVMAYVDAGFYPHPDIADRIQRFVDATTSTIKESNTITKIGPPSWHGMMVATVGSGNGAMSNGIYRSLAPESQLVLIKVSNPKYHVREADIRRGFDWLVKHHVKYNIRVVNVSVGGDRVSHDPDHPLHKAVRQLTEAGVVVVIASGNRGIERLVPPASSPEGIIVGGYDDRNTLHQKEWVDYHSNYGEAYDETPKPDVIAPAQWIPSPLMPDTEVANESLWLGGILDEDEPSTVNKLILKGYRDLHIPKQKAKKPTKKLYDQLQQRIHDHKLINSLYQHVDGTSVAAPIVSSLVAQMIEVNPALTPEQIRTILQDTAQLIDFIPPVKQGAGAIQVDEAVQAVIRQRDKSVILCNHPLASTRSAI